MANKSKSTTKKVAVKKSTKAVIFSLAWSKARVARAKSFEFKEDGLEVFCFNFSTQPSKISSGDARIVKEISEISSMFDQE